MRRSVTTATLLALLAPGLPAAADGPVALAWFGIRGVHEDQQVVKDAAKLVEMAADERKVTLFSDEDVRRELEKSDAWRSAVRDATASLKEARDKYVELDLDAALARVERAEKFLGAACGEALYRREVFDALSLHGLLLWQKGSKAQAVERFRQAIVIAPESRPPAGLFTPDVELGMEEARIAMLGSQKPDPTYDQLCECAWKHGSAFMLLGHVVSSAKGKGIALLLFGAERGDLLASRNAALEGNVEEIKRGLTDAAMALFAAAEEAQGTKKYAGRAPPSTGAPLDLSKIFPPFSQNPWAYSLAGTAVALAGVGIVFSVLTVQAQSDYEALISPERNAAPDPNALDQVKSAGEMRALAATLCYAFAGAAALGSVYFFVWPPGGGDTPSRQSTAQGISKPLSLSPAFVPLPGGGAVTYGLTW